MTIGGIFKAFTLFVVCFLFAANTFSAEFQPIGFEALSMGGAGVACSRGSYAPYYNPALLAIHRRTAEISISPGIAYREINIVNNIDTLADLDSSAAGAVDDDGINGTLEWLSDLSPSDLAQGEVREANLSGQPIFNNLRTIKSVISRLGQKNGLQLMPTASLGVQAGNFGFGAYGLSEATAYASIDQNRQDIIVNTDAGYYIEYDITADTFRSVSRQDYEASSLEYAIENGTSNLTLTGLAYLEIPVAYGHQFLTPFGKVCVGGALKLMHGNTYSDSISLDTESGDIGDRFEDNEKTSTTVGLDLGFLYNHKKLPDLTAGLVFKNLNSPEFDLASGGSLEIEPQVRFGLAYDLWDDRVTFALDADLTKNETYIHGYDSQFIGGGVNFHPASWFSLRGGLMQNMIESDEGTILTAGVGFGLKWFQLDLAGQYSTKSGEYDGNEIPRYSRAKISIVSKWG